MKRWPTHVCFAVLASAGLSACSTQSPETQTFTSGVNGVHEMHLNATFWAEKIRDADQLILDSDAIESLQRDTLLNDPNMVDLSAYPETLPASEIAAKITKYSKPSSSTLYHRQGGEVDAADYQAYTDRMNLSGLKGRVPISFAMVLRRTNMRTWPTEDEVYRTADTYDLDRFQENALFPADMVAVLHRSDDGDWSFVQSYNYAAWVKSKDIATGSRDDMLAFKSAKDFLVVTGAKVRTNFTPEVPSLSELQLDMGIRLPLESAENSPAVINGQNPHASYIVRLPVRNADGSLGFHAALIARSQDVRRGFLPFTHRNILKQAFKFLGERYGWGHAYNGRDCTGFVSEIYKTFGILLPRNSGQQGKSSIGQSVSLSPNASPDEILSVVSNAEAGDLLHSPGHVMMYLGSDKGMPYVIHDLAGFGWIDEQGTLHKGAFNGVSVTPLARVYSSADTRYFEGIYAVRSIR